MGWTPAYAQRDPRPDERKQVERACRRLAALIRPWHPKAAQSSNQADHG